MIFGPTDNWGELRIFDAVRPPDFVLRAMPEMDAVNAVNAVARAVLKRRGLDVQKQSFVSSRMVFPYRGETGRETKSVRRSKLYSLAPVDEVLDAAVDQMNAVAFLGKGRVWFLDTPIICGIGQDGPQFVQHEGDDEIYAVLRTYYGHENQAVPDLQLKGMTT